MAISGTSSEATEEGAGKTWARASLRVFSSVLSVDEITARIGVEPSSSRRKGDLMSPRNPKSSRQEQSVWIFDSGLPSTDPMPKHLESIRHFVEPRVDQLGSLSGEARVDLLLGWRQTTDQASVVIDRNLCQALATVGAAIVLDLYRD